MPSIRKTKKRLKMAIAEDRTLMTKLECVKFPTLRQSFVYDALRRDIIFLKSELHNLTKKKNDTTRTSYKLC